MKMKGDHRRVRWRDTIYLLSYVSILVRLVSGEQRFNQQPEDLTAKHGESVTLPCKVADRRGAVQWTKDGFGLGTDPDLQGFSRYRMEVNDSDGVYNLHIQPVLVEDDGVYQCQVGGTEGERHLKSDSATLTVHFPPADSSDQVYLDKTSPMDTTAGAPIRITCEAGLSSPASTIKWYMNDNEGVPGGQVNTTKVPQGGSILVAVKSRLDLTPERKHHEANISCHVSHKALEEPIVRTVVMIVKYPPEVTIAVDSAKIKENDDVNFTCQAEGNPSDLRYRWEMDGVAVVGDHTSYYLLSNIQRQANGVGVACIVSNSIGATRKEHKLSVEYAPRFKVEPQDVDEDEGKEVTLTCDVDSNPTPEIVWLHDTQQKVINLGTKLTLKVGPETIGTYHCRAAATGFPEETRSMRVFQRGPPVVTPLEDQFGLEGDTVMVECEVKSIPRPSQVLWAKQGHDIDPNESRYNVLQERTTEGVLNKLVILEARRPDFGSYNCTAKNDYGSHTAALLLKRQQSLPLVTTLVAIIGGIVFLIVVIVVILLFKKKGRGYKDSGLEKHSMRSSDRSSSTHDSVHKVETRTATGSDLSPSEDDYSSHDDWDASDSTVPNPPRRHHNTLRYTQPMEYNDVGFPLKDNPNNNSGDYVPYVNYSQEYNPPPPINYNRNSFYSTPTPLNNINPHLSAAYGNPYLRRGTQLEAIYGSSGGLDSTTLPPGGGGEGGGGPGVQYTGGGGPPISLNNNNNNNLNNTTTTNSSTAIYGQLGHNRNNIRASVNLNNQYIMGPQGDGRLGVHGTHI